MKLGHDVVVEKKEEGEKKEGGEEPIVRLRTGLAKRIPDGEGVEKESE